MNKSVIFFGTPDFAVASLDFLIKNNIKVLAVVTAPDKPAGRGKKLTFSPLKVYALEQNLTVFQPENLKDIDFIINLKKLNADLFVVVAFRKLPTDIWQLPHSGTINLHASLLPQYRGAAPINWVIINGETETGLTTFFINENIDKGNIIDSVTVEILKEENFGDLYDKMKFVGAELLYKTVINIFENKIIPKKQENYMEESKNLKKAPKINKIDCKLSWNDTANNIINKIRGLSPIPAAFTNIISNENQLFVKIFKASAVISIHNYPIGKILTDGKNYLRISVSDGFVNIDTIQIAGKNKMNIIDFLRGNNVKSFLKAE